MLTSLLLFIYKIFNKQEELQMLVRLYASEIILERITLEDVPKRLRAKVKAYLEEMGYDFES